MASMLDRFGQYNAGLWPLNVPPPDVLDLNETQVVTQAADQSVTASVSAVQITNLEFEFEANKSYRIRAWVPFALAGTASGYKFSISAPASPTNIAIRERVTNGVTPALVSETFKDSYSGVNAALAEIGTHFLEIDGTIENGANAGPLFLRFAQNASDAAAITVKRGAYLEISRIS